ncbi:alpha/beta hydrolase [bacterium]|nr:alpha/beta hydrolase [bacterium]
MTSQGELVRVRAEDGLELVGFYAAPPGGARRAVLHTHGLAGNFYENRFVDAVCDTVVSKGLGFLTYNNRGHDYASDNLRGRGIETRYEPGGIAWDIFEHCLFDIGGCAEFLASRGHREIYFQGHSLGTCKTVYYLSERRDPRAVGAVLISPPDMFGLREERTGRELVELLAEAREAVAGGAPDTKIEVGRTVPITARAFLSTYSDASRSDIFPFRQGVEGDYTRYASLDIPVLATFGTVDEAVTVPVADAVELTRSRAARSPRVDVAAIEDANHMYWGKEAELAEVLGGFVEP